MNSDGERRSLHSRCPETISGLLAGNLAMTALHWSVDGKRGRLAAWLGAAWKLHLEGDLPR